MLRKFGQWTALAAVTGLSSACGDDSRAPIGPSGSGGGRYTGGTTGTGGDQDPDGSIGIGGTTGSGGSTSTGGLAGSVGSGGSPGGGASFDAGGPVLVGTATRPQLTADDAQNYTVLKYLAQAGTIGAMVPDHWDPTAGLGDVSALAPTFTVGPKGTHTTVQAAIDAAAAMGGTARLYILVQPGTYRELVCVRTPVPITLYGADSDASKVVIVYDNYSAKPNDSVGNPCKPPTQGTATYGTSSSATFIVYARDFQAKNLTISNDYADNPTSQAVALLTSTDKIVLENVRLLGNQDTFYVTSGGPTLVTRLYMKDSYVEGDTDFVFGRGTAVLDGVTLHSLATKTGGTPLAPSTAPGNPYGFLVINGNFTAATGLADDSTYLGRAWDEGAGSGYVSGSSPNGQALVRDSMIGAHIRTNDPWTNAATTKRPYSTTGNRLYEYDNTGPGAAM